MGGKRPDQYQIDPSEGGATDYKNLPQTGRGHSDDLDTTRIDKQQLAQNRERAEGQPFLPDVPAPSSHANRGEKISPDQESEEEMRAEIRREAEGTEDPRDRGVGG